MSRQRRTSHIITLLNILDLSYTGTQLLAKYITPLITRANTIIDFAFRLRQWERIAYTVDCGPDIHSGRGPKGRRDAVAELYLHSFEAPTKHEKKEAMALERAALSGW